MRGNPSREGEIPAIVLQRYLVQEAGVTGQGLGAGNTRVQRQCRSKEIENDNVNGREEKSTNINGENSALQKSMCNSKLIESHVTSVHAVRCPTKAV